MKARPFKQSTTTAHPEPVTNEIVREALAQQARNRPPKPTMSLPLRPPLPRQPKPHRRRPKK
jgi:hypothetical protein